MQQKLFERKAFGAAAKGMTKLGVLTGVASFITGLGDPVEVALATIICAGTIVGTSYALGFHHGRFNLNSPARIPYLVFSECMLCIGITHLVLGIYGATEISVPGLSLDMVMGFALGYGAICYMKSRFNAFRESTEIVMYEQFLGKAWHAYLDSPDQGAKALQPGRPG